MGPERRVEHREIFRIALKIECTAFGGFHLLQVYKSSDLCS